MPVIAELPTHIQGIIFDCDGVMINSRDGNLLYYNKILEACGLAPMTPAQESYVHMSTVQQAFAHILPEHMLPKLKEICATKVVYERDIMPLVELEAHFYDFAKWLLQKNIRCAVHTNRSNGMRLVINKFPFLRDFAPVITASDVAPKPHPEGVFKILSTWDLPKENVIFIGDSLTDQQAASGAEVAFVAYGNEKLDAALNISNFKALQKVLETRMAP